MRVLGIDPDTHDIGFAIAEGGVVTAISVVRLPTVVKNIPQRRDKAIIQLVGSDKLTDTLHTILSTGDIDRVVIEGQQIYLKSKAKPQDQLYLAQAAGAILARVADLLPEAEIKMPLPQKWKGTIPKYVKHRRILQDQEGWTYYEENKRILVDQVPEDVELLADVPQAAWTHVIDAMGLAVWGS